MDNFLIQLNDFLLQATKACYAGDGPRSQSTCRFGHYDLKYQDQDWYYRDSFAGYFQSWGQEIVWYKDKPVWTQLYGGGLEFAYKTDQEFARQTFAFLKKALWQGKQAKVFSPRGLQKFKFSDWCYDSNWSGDLSNFSGTESIVYQGKLVFKYRFLGGIFESR